MLSINYKQSQQDHALFIKHLEAVGVTLLLVDVDDIIVTLNYEGDDTTLKQCLVKEFEIKELERLKYFLHIEVSHSKTGIFLAKVHSNYFKGN